MHAAATIAFADPWQTSIGTPFSLKLNRTKIMSRSQGINCFEFGCISAKLKTVVQNRQPQNSGKCCQMARRSALYTFFWLLQCSRTMCSSRRLWF